MTYRIKRVDGTDEEIADTIRWMHTVCFAHTAPQVEPEYDWWWVVYLDKEPCAFAALSETTAHKSIGYLKRVGVLPEHRGQGLQRRLIQVRETLARKFDMTLMVTDTTGNPASANTLIKAGYRLYHPQDPWAFRCDRGNHSLYWSKKL